MAGVVQPYVSATMSSLADITVTTTATQISALTQGPNGIILTAHPNNGSVIIRISGSDASSAKGQPLAAGSSMVLNNGNANILYAVTESTTATLCVSQV